MNIPQPFVALWPIHGHAADGPPPPLLDYLPEAVAQLPAIAVAAGVRLDPHAPVTFHVTPGERVPGAGGAPWVLIANSHATPTRKRTYRRRSPDRRALATNGK